MARYEFEVQSGYSEVTQRGDAMGAVLVFDFKTPLHDLNRLTVFASGSSPNRCVREDPNRERLVVDCAFSDFGCFAHFLAKVADVYGVWETAPNGEVTHFSLQLEHKKTPVARTEAGAEEDLSVDR